MRDTLSLGALAAALLAAPAAAQSGFALKGGAVFNSSDVTVEQGFPRFDPADAAGFHAGAEVVLPGGLGVGLSGYTYGSPEDFDTRSSRFVALGEANYFLRLPGLPVAPYAGVNVGLGTYELEDIDPGMPRPEVDFDDLGWQAGVRLQLNAALGLDAQLRQVNGSFTDGDATFATFSNRQVLVGLTLF